MKLESLGGGNESRRRVTCLLLLLLRDMATHLKARRRRSHRTQASDLLLLQFLRESKVSTAENYAAQTKIGKNAGKQERKTKNTKRYLQTLRYRKRLRKKKKEKRDRNNDKRKIGFVW